MRFVFAFLALLASLGVKPAFAVTDRSGKPVVGVETHVYQNGAVRIIALNSNPQLRVDELGPPDAHVEIAAKKAAGYYTPEAPKPDDLKTSGRPLEKY